MTTNNHRSTIRLNATLDQLICNKPWAIITPKGALVVLDDRTPIFWKRRDAMTAADKAGLDDRYVIERIELLRRNRRNDG